MSQFIFRLRALAVVAAMLAVAPAAFAHDILNLPGQRFEWQKNSKNRWDGTYGQYQVTLTAGEPYEIFTSNIVAGTTSDPYLYLLNAAGTVILAQDDDAGGGNNARIEYTPTTTGSYLVRLRSFTKNKWGTCTLTVREPQAPPPTPEIVLHAGDVLNGQTFTWQAAFSSRADGTYGQYAIDMAAGITYTFETSNAVGGGADTFLYLLNGSLAVVKLDDDSGEGFHSKLTFQPATSARYYVRLRAYTQGAAGTCTMRVTGLDLGPGTPLLPDLITWVTNQYLRDAHISVENGVTLLRFSNTVANRGAGAMELYGVVNPTNGQTDAYQVVYNDNGSQTTNLVGTFSFMGHESHNHWHFDDFAIYELRALDGTLLRSSDKVSFCLLDYAKYTDETISGAPSSSVYSCTNQGISVGWADVYSAGLEGQYIDVTGLADGTYRLVSTADPFDRLFEEPRSNNASEVTLTISQGSVTVLP